jgi:hypothetical protein
VVLLLDEDLVSWSLFMDEHDGHKDLYGSDRRSIIPYIQGKIELYYSRLYAGVYLLSAPVKRCLPGPFIPQGRIVTMRPEARQVGPS